MKKEERLALEQSLSPTPRVNALEKEYHSKLSKRLRVWDLARELERELISAQRRYNELAVLHGGQPIYKVSNAAPSGSTQENK